MISAEAVAAADGNFAAGEAAFTVACYARDACDTAYLLDVLGLSGAVTRWDTPRAVRLALVRCRHGKFTSAAVMRLLPDRAATLTGPAIAGMRAAGLAARAGLVTAAGGRRDAAWVLTPAGRNLSDQLLGLPCAGPYTGPNWLLYDN